MTRNALAYVVMTALAWVFVWIALGLLARIAWALLSLGWVK